MQRDWEAEQREEFRWTTIDGRKLRPSDMDDRHLLNCIRMLERNKRSIRDDRAFLLELQAADCSGDAARDSVENAAWQLYHSEDVEDICWEERFLWEEARRRGLIPSKEN